uniref:GPI ethanolamine phosphate transferase 1 n=1 Tax=Rhodnius prolixus TaxID=13249 RepID=A0A4P6D7J7_RHOPR
MESNQRKILDIFPGKSLFIFWLSAIIVHTILLLSAWDMFPAEDAYPELPPATEPRHIASSKRAVLFLVGALNASVFYRTMNSMEYSMINSIVTESGRWGITWSSDQSSTENLQRLLSGTVNNDLAWFNTSTLSKPDDLVKYLNQVIYIGSKVNVEHINTTKWEIYSYPENWDIYTKKYDDVAMDMWVTDQTKTLLKDLKFLKTLPTEKTLFIIYFDGVKTLNKYEGKYSVKIGEAVARILLNIEAIVYRFKKTFNDEKTLFILASDYSTSDIKEYVSDAPTNVATPIIAWGRQITGHLLTKTKEWSVLIRDRKDIDPEDLTTLLACLLGIPTPAHSVGQLPFNYLWQNSSIIARCAMANVKQLQALYKSISDRVNLGALVKLSDLFSPVDSGKLDSLYSTFEVNVDRGKYNVVIDETNTLIMRLLDGINHYRYYYSRMAKLLAFGAYSGWLLYLCSDMIDSSIKVTNRTPSKARDIRQSPRENDEKHSTAVPETSAKHWTNFWKRLLIRSTKLSGLINILYIAISTLVTALIISAAWPARIIIYLLTMLTTWWTVLKYRKRWLACRNFLLIRNALFSRVEFCAFLMLLILTCCFFLNNIVLSVIMLLMMLVLPFADYQHVQNCYLADWMLSSIMLHFSLCYSSELSTNLIWYLLQAIFGMICSLVASKILATKLVDCPLLVLSLLAIILAVITNYLLQENIITKNFWLWTIILIIVLNVFIGSNVFPVRLMQNCNFLSVPYLLTAEGYEPITFLSIVVNLYSWVNVETYNKDNEEQRLPFMNEIPYKLRMKRKQIKWKDKRRAFICFTYILVSYLALGNDKNIIHVFKNINMGYNYTNWSPLFIFLVKTHLHDHDSEHVLLDNHETVWQKHENRATMYAHHNGDCRIHTIDYCYSGEHFDH